jgi:non-lysosomal glucosylceramidase
MSSGSLLPALAGWEYDGPRQALRFMPRHTPEQFKGFFTSPEGWGSLSQSRQGQSQRNEISVCEGRLPISSLAFAAATAPKQVKVQCADKPIDCTSSFSDGMLTVLLKRPAVVEAGQILLARLG